MPCPIMLLCNDLDVTVREAVPSGQAGRVAMEWDRTTVGESSPTG
jgi:hypothetical protein